jgi:predicted small secreted protein
LSGFSAFSDVINPHYGTNSNPSVSTIYRCNQAHPDAWLFITEDTIMKQLKILGAAVCAALLSSCNTTGGRDTPRLASLLGDTTGQNGRSCVKVSDIEGYGVLEDNVLSIESENDEHYLATVTPGCEDLPTTVRLQFSGDFGEICGQAMDEIIMGEDRCTINQLFEFDDRDDAMDAYHATLELREQLDNRPSS